jgi:hypothetical protein
MNAPLPHCPRRFLLRLANGLALIIVAACRSNAPAPPLASPAAIVNVSAAELYDAYVNNEDDATKRFTGRRLLVTGMVDRVGRELSGVQYVKFGDGDRVHAQGTFVVNRSIEAAGGQIVHAECLCDGRIGSSVMLVDCTLKR